MVWLTTKVVQKGLKKGGYNFSYDGTPDWEKESSVNKSKEKYDAESLNYVTGNESRVVTHHIIFSFFFIWKLLMPYH